MVENVFAPLFKFAPEECGKCISQNCSNSAQEFLVYQLLMNEFSEQLVASELQESLVALLNTSQTTDSMFKILAIMNSNAGLMRDDSFTGSLNVLIRSLTKSERLLAHNKTKAEAIIGNSLFIK